MTRSPLSSPHLPRRFNSKSRRSNSQSSQVSEKEESTNAPSPPAKEWSLQELAEGVVSNSGVSLPVNVTVTESSPDETGPLAIGSSFVIVRHNFTEVVHFTDERGHSLCESSSYNEQRFVLLPNEPELDGVQFKTLNEAMQHKPAPNKLSCLSSWTEHSAENVDEPSLEVDDVIEIFDSLTEHGADGRVYHKVQRLRNFTKYGEPVCVPAETKISLSTNLSGKGYLLPDIIKLKRSNALSFPLRVQLMQTSQSNGGKYTLCDLAVEKSFVVRVLNSAGGFDTMRLPVTTPLRLKVERPSQIPADLLQAGVQNISHMPMLGQQLPGLPPPLEEALESINSEPSSPCAKQEVCNTLPHNRKQSVCVSAMSYEQHKSRLLPPVTLPQPQREIVSDNSQSDQLLHGKEKLPTANTGDTKRASICDGRLEEHSTKNLYSNPLLSHSQVHINTEEQITNGDGGEEQYIEMLPSRLEEPQWRHPSLPSSYSPTLPLKSPVNMQQRHVEAQDSAHTNWQEKYFQEKKDHEATKADLRRQKRLNSGVQFATAPSLCSIQGDIDQEWEKRYQQLADKLINLIADATKQAVESKLEEVVTGLKSTHGMKINTENGT